MVDHKAATLADFFFKLRTDKGPELRSLMIRSIYKPVAVSN